MPIFLDCCTGEVEIVIPPPPPPVPPNCCTVCPTLTVTPSIIDASTWENTINVSAVCLDGLTYTLQRSTSNAPNAVWMPMGTWTGSIIIDTGLPRTQTSYWYRIVVSGQGTVGCFLNCANPSLAQATVPVCCVYSMTINNGQPVIIPLGDTSVSFNVTFTNTGGANCVADTPPVLLLALTLSQVGALATVGAGSGNNNLYTYPVTISNIDTRNTLLVGFSAVVPCSGQVLSRTDFPISGTPSCCGASAFSSVPGAFLDSPNRLHPNYPSVSQPATPSPLSMSGVLPSIGYAGVKRTSSLPFITTSNWDSIPFRATNAWGYSNESAVITPINPTEDEYELVINIPTPSSCGTNKFSLRFIEYNGNVIDAVVSNTPNLQTGVTGNYSKERVTHPNYQATLAVDDTFWNHYRNTNVVAPGISQAIMAVYGGNVITGFPHYALSNAPIATPYIISHTVSGGTFNPVTAVAELSTNTTFILTLRMKFQIQNGQGISPYLRGGSETPQSNTFIATGYDRFFTCELNPIDSSPICNAIGRTAFRLNHCNQFMRGTITGSAGGVTVNARPVWDGGSANSLTPTLSIDLSSDSMAKRGVVREFSVTGSGAANLFQLNRNGVPAVNNEFLVNNDWYATCIPKTIADVELNIFNNKEAFRQGVIVPFRISENTTPNTTNITNNLVLPRYTHLLGYELTKVVEENFTTIFPSTNTGAWAGFGNGATGFSTAITGAHVFPINGFQIDMNINPIINFLQNRLVTNTDMKPCCGFGNFTSFKLSFLLYMEVGVMQAYMETGGASIKKGRGRNYALATTYINNTNTLESEVVAPTAFVVELDINLVTATINSISYREKQLISTFTQTTGVDRLSSAGYLNTPSLLYLNKAWRTAPFDMSVTEPSTNVLRFTNSSAINTLAHVNRGFGFRPLRSASQTTPTDFQTLFLCPNLLITTMNLCPEYSSLAPDLTDLNNCNCNYVGTVYNSLGAGSQAQIINPNIKGEVVSDLAQVVSGATWGGVGFGSNTPQNNTGATQNINAYYERKATLTSPYCNITTLPIALSILAGTHSNPGRADFML